MGLLQSPQRSSLKSDFRDGVALEVRTFQASEIFVTPGELAISSPRSPAPGVEHFIWDVEKTAYFTWVPPPPTVFVALKKRDCCSRSTPSGLLKVAIYSWDCLSNKTLWPNATWEGKGLFHLATFRSHPPSLREVRAGTQPGRNLEVGTEVGTMKECYLLACSTCFLPVPITTTLSEQGPSTATVKKRKCTGLPRGQSCRGVFSIEVHFIEITAVFCQVDIKWAKTRTHLQAREMSATWRLYFGRGGTSWVQLYPSFLTVEVFLHAWASLWPFQKLPFIYRNLVLMGQGDTPQYTPHFWLFMNLSS